MRFFGKEIAGNFHVTVRVASQTAHSLTFGIPDRESNEIKPLLVSKVYGWHFPRSVQSSISEALCFVVDPWTNACRAARLIEFFFVQSELFLKFVGSKCSGCW